MNDADRMTRFEFCLNLRGGKRRSYILEDDPFLAVLLSKTISLRDHGEIFMHQARTLVDRGAIREVSLDKLFEVMTYECEVLS